IAVVVLAVLIVVLGVLAQTRGGDSPGVLGLKGVGGALLFVALNVGALVLVVAGFRAVVRRLGRQASLDALLLRLPGLGPCLRSLALGRFALALRATLETGMPITRALALSLRATGNAAFEAQTDAVVKALKAGDDLTLALAQGGVFPQEFLHMVAVAEEG